MTFKQVGVVGAGTMSGAIAHQMALSGCSVVLADMDNAVLERAISRMRSWMDKSVSKGKMTPNDVEDTLGRLKLTTNLQDLAGVPFVLEAVFEDLHLVSLVNDSPDSFVLIHQILTVSASRLNHCMMSTT